jgi:endonuclease-3 related protein
MHFGKQETQSDMGLGGSIGPGVACFRLDRLLTDVAQPQTLSDFYRVLAEAWGNPHWWPARTPFEVIVGAYLTQNTNWINVEKALCRLREAGVLSLAGIRRTPQRKLESLIRSSGYFRQKARRLKIFVAFLDNRYGGSLARMFTLPTDKLRAELLELDGVGSETADSILLYAGQHPIFVADAYTRRILCRHGIVAEDASYDEIQAVCQTALSTPIETSPLPAQKTGAPGACHPPSAMSCAKRPALAQMYNEIHGLIVGVGKNYCFKSAPRCDECPLQNFPHKFQSPK